MLAKALVERSIVPPIDPQVATMSNLTNAANSIVMYGAKFALRIPN